MIGFGLLAFFAPCLSQASPSRTAYRVANLHAEGRAIPIDRDLPEVRLTHGIRDITFGIEPTDPAGPPIRFRFQLLGHDADWRDPGGSMRFTVRFDEQEGNTIFGEEFQLSHQSPGWTGDPRSSAPVSRSENIPIPKGASKMQFWMGSAGPQATLGVYAVSDLRVQLFGDSEHAAQSALVMIREEGALMDSPSGTPKGWARHGSRLGVAQIAPRSDAAPFIVMRDDQTDSFGGWLTTAASLDVSHAKTATITWNECYSIGWGGPARAIYNYLPPGHYTLRIQTASIEGTIIDESDIAQLHIIPPFHRSSTFRVTLALIIVSAGAWTVRSVTRARMQQELDRLAKEHTIDVERSRIARDLHDSLGADLTHLGLLCDLAASQVYEPERVRPHLNELFDLAKQLTRRVDEMVWTVNPAHDTLRGLISFVTHHAQSYLRAAGIACRLDVPDPIPNTPLSSSRRHHLFLTVKEALHNVVKHSEASEVRIRIRHSTERLEVEIEDNGKGIVNAAEGDGSENMRNRINSINGTLQRISEPGRGTLVTILLPIPPNERA